jgi:hypothetical protein
MHDVHLQRELTPVNHVLAGGMEVQADGLGLHMRDGSLCGVELGDERAGGRVTWNNRGAISMVVGLEARKTRW